MITWFPWLKTPQITKHVHSSGNTYTPTHRAYHIIFLLSNPIIFPEQWQIYVYIYIHIFLFYFIFIFFKGKNVPRRHFDKSFKLITFYIPCPVWLISSQSPSFHIVFICLCWTHLLNVIFSLVGLKVAVEAGRGNMRVAWSRTKSKIRGQSAHRDNCSTLRN